MHHQYGVKTLLMLDAKEPALGPEVALVEQNGEKAGPGFGLLAHAAHSGHQTRPTRDLAELAGLGRPSRAKEQQKTPRETMKRAQRWGERLTKLPTDAHDCISTLTEDYEAVRNTMQAARLAHGPAK